MSKRLPIFESRENPILQIGTRYCIWKTAYRRGLRQKKYN